jgi:DNA-3-methyladenine glycosylase
MNVLTLKDVRPLRRNFYKPSAAQVAPELLGHWLLRRSGDKYFGGPIVEVEAYIQGDEACHAAKGLTLRNRVMFGAPGNAYVYFIYGCHFCVNAVCCPAGMGEAVLIRAIEPLFDEEAMKAHRPAGRRRDLTNGPGKLCQALEIKRKLNGADLCDTQSPLIIARNPGWKRFLGERGPVRTSRRIGITRAAHLPLRFYLAASEFLSRTPPAG